MRKFVILMIFLLFTNACESQIYDPDCQKVSGEKKKFKCTISNVKDVTSFKCAVATHTCSATRIDHVKVSTTDEEGTLTYFIEVTLRAYTTNTISVTVNDVDTSGNDQAFANSVDLQCDLEDEEKPRIICQNVISNDNNFESTVQCDIFVSQSSYELKKVENNDCGLTIPTTNPENVGILYKKSYSVTINDKIKTCLSTCQVSVKIEDTDSTGNEISTTLSHTSQCNGHNIECSAHDDKTRQITCQITIPYDYSHITFTSTKEHVQLETASERHTSTNDKGSFQKVITYTLTDWKIDDKTFNINYVVYQTETTQTLSGSYNSGYAYVLRQDELPMLQCKIEARKDGLQYYEKMYKCSARSFDSQITIQVNPSKFTVSPSTNNGRSQNNIYEHEEFEIRLTSSDIVCNKLEDIKLFFTENGHQRSNDIQQTIQCPNPSIIVKKNDPAKREITWTLKALYSFTITGVTTANDKIVVKPETQSVVATKDSREFKAEYSVTYDSTDLTVKQRKFTTVLSFTHNEIFGSSVISEELTWEGNKDESPSLKCKLKESEVPVDINQFVVTCDASTLDENFELESTPVQFKIIAKRVKKQKYKGIYRWKNYEIVIEDKELICGADQEITIGFVDTNENLSDSLKRQVTCSEPTVLCNQHDEIARTLKCKFKVPYPILEIQISSTVPQINVEPNKILKNSLREENDLLYKPSNQISTSTQFSITFQFKQKETSIVHTKSVSVQCTPSRAETTQFSCITKDQQALNTQGTISYKCKVITMTVELEIKTHPATYRVNPEKTTSKQVKGLYMEDNYEISLTPVAMNCGQSEIVRVYFTQNNIEYSTSVNHTTLCPAPIIKCDEHDMVNRIIKCDFTISFVFHEIKLLETSGVVTLDSSKILSSEFNGNTLQKYRIKYSISDPKTASASFIINFRIIQNSGKIAFENVIGFRYFIKSNENPRITCNSINTQKKHRFESELYECVVVSHSSKIDLKTATEGFQISPSEVQGNLNHGIYTHENFILTVIPNEIKCDEQSDVEISFKENSEDFKFTVKHTTVCPDPTINCDIHDYEKREITCGVKIIFPFTTINLVSDSPENVNIISGTTISYDQLKTDVGYSHTLTYELKNLKIRTRNFQIQFTVVRNGANYLTITKSFQYLLKSSETPHMLCNKKQLNPPDAEFESIYYSCNIISHDAPANLISDPSTYTRTYNQFNVQKTNEIYVVNNHDLKMKPSQYNCINPVSVTISLNQKGSTSEFTAFHQTKCPEPVIECPGHDLDKKTITCKVKVDFKFKEIRISTFSSNVMILANNNNNKISPDSEGKCDLNSQKIEYSINNYLSKHTIFDITFEIVQHDDTIIFKISRYFKYTLTQNENPYIKCSESIESNLKFYQTKYTCEIVSVNKEISLELFPSSYQINKVSSNGADHGSLYKHTNVDLIVEPKSIICDRKEIISIILTDRDNKRRFEYLSHITKCPDPIVSIESFHSTNRKFILKLEAEYDYKVLRVVSNTQSVNLLYDNVDDIYIYIYHKWTRTLTISYEPNDWSINSQKFKAIIEVGQDVSWKTTVTSDERPCDLKAIEKSHVSCESTATENEYFNQKVFTCQARTRQSIMMLNTSDTNYKIVSATGSSNEHKNVHQWNDHKIVIQDVIITCNTIKALDVFFVEYTERYKSSITMSITCPVPKITMTHHDTEQRTILYKVESEIPSYRTKIVYNGNVVTLSKSESVIKKSGRKWHSSITVSYTVKDLLKTQFTIPFSFGIEQHQQSIGSVALSFDYILHENEKRQITCNVNENRTLSQFTVTEYICYVVGIESLSISINPTTYKLSYDTTAPLQFMNIRKWENVSVRVEDTSILCNKTVNVTLTNHDGDEKFSTIVQHTTICDKIYGDCYINHNDVTYIFCNFTSNTKFNLRNFTCSNAFNCTSSKEVEKVGEKWNEFAFELTPLSTETYLEFDFHITLEHSIHSPVPFIFKLAYSTQSESVEIQKPATAKIVTSFSNSIIYLAIFAVMLTYVMLRRWKISFNPREHCEKTNFRNL